jgi:hypothetical protein
MINPMHTLAWLILRLVYAWMFLYPLKDLLTDWRGTVHLASFIIPFAPKLGALGTLGIMLLGAVSILLGFYPTVGGFLLLIYCLLGGYVHWSLAKQAEHLSLTASSSSANRTILEAAKTLAIQGHVSSGQKNMVLAAVGCFFMLMGTGPLSLGGL